MQQVSSIAACTLHYIQRQEEFKNIPGWVRFTGTIL